LFEESECWSFDSSEEQGQLMSGGLHDFGFAGAPEALMLEWAAFNPGCQAILPDLGQLEP